MSLQHKLKDPVFRSVFIKVVISLIFTILFAFFCYKLYDFVNLTQSVVERFKRTHSHVWEVEENKEIPYYGCKCSDIKDTFVCLECTLGDQHQIIPDTPEQTFQRCFNEMVIRVCPLLILNRNTCSALLEPMLRMVIFSMERVLSVLVGIISSLIFLLYMYCFPYAYIHQLMDVNHALKLQTVRNGVIDPDLHLNRKKKTF
jgi:hypothetical protein